MGTFSGAALRLLLAAWYLVLALNTEVFADRIGGSSLPSPTPALKGRIVEGEGATSVVVVSTAAGWSSNAGPTFFETPSSFVDRGVGYAQVMQTPLGAVDFNVTLADRRYFAFTDADERSGQANLALTRDWEGQQTLLAFAAGTSRDIEERLTMASLSLTHTWNGETVRPFVQAETAVLDFHDLPGEFEPFANQDDRDRISSRAQAGLRLTITEHLSVEVGGGVDTKRYLEKHDDFGVQRDSVSLFPLVGLAFATEMASLRAVYMPFRRVFEDDLFESTWTHGYAVDAEVKFSNALKAIASARHGFEETDFLIASAAYETVLVAGVMLTPAWGTLSLAVSETRRDYDGLHLLDIMRADRKREVALSGEVPLWDAVSLTGRVSYMDFESTLGEGGFFGEIATDVLTVSLGLTYVMAQ
ncbi:hypothetical protein W911_02900 [Hyphomicrobium nitrativorans NL23]|uniref:Uncharacterized protein n=1 Tax=Hyphomicrobium nitrativorans NL23 TaxID=1029756 RepID=V5SG82_9HYPH|nr:hypothetical protein W911_02900 [Hyphomicrobium nitrativorans NL23]